MAISICIPLYKSNPAFLNALLCSVDTQDLRPDEVVIVDDASPESPREAVQAFSGTLPLVYARNPTNLGMAQNWNAAVRKSRGDFVMVVSQDDVLESTTCSALHSRLCINTRIVLCGGHHSLIDEHGRLLDKGLRATDRRFIFIKQRFYSLDHAEVLALSLRNGNVIGEPSAVMFRRKGFDTVGGYDADLRHAADLDFNIRMSALGLTGFVNEIVVRRRMHKASATHANALSGEITRERVILMERYLPLVATNGRLTQDIRADLFLRSFRDLILGTFTARCKVVGQAWRAVRQILPVAPNRVWARAKELLLGVNCDAR